MERQPVIPCGWFRCSCLASTHVEFRKRVFGLRTLSGKKVPAPVERRALCDKHTAAARFQYLEVTEKELDYIRFD